MANVTKKHAKLLAATVGGGALVVMGAFTALAGNPQPATGPLMISDGMSTGVTVTETTAPASLATSEAVPAVKAVAYQ